MTVIIGRRELLAALGGAAAVWPLAARAQHAEQMRRIGVLINLAADDPHYGVRTGAAGSGLGYRTTNSAACLAITSVPPPAQR